MAAGPGDNPRGVLRRLESEVTCPLCLDIFTDPRRLPCDHVYCRECLRRLALRSITGSISCPECRRDVPVPNYSATNFSVPLSIVRLVDMYREYLQSAETEAATPQPACCKVHDSQGLDLYCESCETLVCRDCVILYCAKGNHKYAFIDQMVEKYQSELNSELEPIRKLHQQMSDTLIAVSAAESETQGLKEAKLKKMHSAFDTLSDVLAQERRYFTESIDKSFQEQESITSAKKTDILKVMSKLELLIRSVENASQSESSQVFLAGVANKKQDIERAKMASSEQSPYSVKIPTTEVELCDTKELKDFLQIKNFLHERADVSKSRVERSLDLSDACVNKSSEFCFYLDPQGILFGKVNIEAQLYSSHSGSSRAVTVRQLTPEKHSLAFTPIERGKHVLNIKYNDVHVRGSPISLHVTILPQQLKRLKFNFKRMANVAGLKYHDGKLYASAGKYGIIILDASTKAVLKTIKMPGVCEILIDDDHIYATASQRVLLIKMDMDEPIIIKSVGSRGVGPGQFVTPNGIRLSKDNEIYVCDSELNRIQVFDKDLNFIRIIGGPGEANGRFHTCNDLDFDVAGNLYVVDNRNHRIQVLTPQGKHIRNIGRYGRKQGELRHPCSAAIQGDMIYITDRINKRIAVFKLSGEFVTTFGEGSMSLPECIAIDNDGYIHVTDDRSKIITF